MKIIFQLLILNFVLVSCSKFEDKDVEITLDCRGKTFFTQGSSSWSKERVSSYDSVEVFEINNKFKTQDGRKWSFKKGNFTYMNEVGDGPNQPGHPNWYRNVSVSDTEITLSKSGTTGFDEKKTDNDRMNQRDEYRDELKINRISGEYTDDNSSKTTWKDGSWVSLRWFTKGSCTKGEKKF